MSELDKILREDKEWYKQFHSIPVTNKCDAGCGKEATTWFGNTSCATCGDSRCVAEMQREHDKIRQEYDEERGWYD